MSTAHLNGIDVYYEIAGSGQPLLFIHGLGSSSQDWRAQIDVLEADYQCISYDVRGHGRSSKPPGPYSVAQFAADAKELLQHLEIERAHFIGLSMGAMITFQTVVDFPDSVRSMVIINALPSIPNRTLKEKWAIWQRLILFRLFSMERIGRIIGSRLFPAEDQAEMRQEFVDRWKKNDKRAYMAATKALAGWSVEVHLSTIQAPTLVIAGEQDYSPVAAKEAFVSRMPKAELVTLADAGHAVNVVQPERVNPVIQQFLERFG